MSARLDGLSERSEMEARLAPAGAAGAQRGYDVAARLARNGASIDELVDSCGVTRHEAELLVRLQNALEHGRLRAVNRELSEESGRRWELIGRSAAMDRVRELVERVAPTPARVLRAERRIGRSRSEGW